VNDELAFGSYAQVKPVLVRVYISLSLYPMQLLRMRMSWGYASQICWPAGALADTA